MPASRPLAPSGMVEEAFHGTPGGVSENDSAFPGGEGAPTAEVGGEWGGRLGRGGFKIRIHTRMGGNLSAF